MSSNKFWILSWSSVSNCGFEFEKRSQLFICVHNKASRVLTLCGHNPKLSAVRDPYLRYNRCAIGCLSAMMSQHFTAARILPCSRSGLQTQVIIAPPITNLSVTARAGGRYLPKGKIHLDRQYRRGMNTIPSLDRQVSHISARRWPRLEPDG